jgi:hypothetical protein
MFFRNIIAIIHERKEEWFGSKNAFQEVDTG